MTLVPANLNVDGAADLRHDRFRLVVGDNTPNYGRHPPETPFDPEEHS